MQNSQLLVLTDFAPIQIAKPVSQRVALELMAYGFAKAYCRIHQVDEKDGFKKVHHDVKEKFSKYGVSPSLIKRRQLIFFPRLKDIRYRGGELAIAEPEHEYLKLFDSYESFTPKDIRTRQVVSFAEVADRCLAGLYESASEAPDDIIHVTSAGYLAPSPVQRMVARKEWFRTTVTHCYHMGCYAAFPAVRMAHGFLSSSQFGATAPKQRVDIVHTEVPSVHGSVEELTAESIIVMTLFGDGLIKYSLITESLAREQGKRGLKILAFSECLLPNSADHMTLVLGPTRLHMSLSYMVPVLIKQSVRPFVTALLRHVGIDFERERGRLAFAIHPGGPKIVEHVKDELGLGDDQVEISHRIFAEHGNMTSATVPHILKEMVDDQRIAVGTRIVSLAFGPGLTATGLVLEKM